jgi:hypothetical protein
MLFSNDEYDSILLGFEDLHRLDPSRNVYGFPSDDDFNDTIFCLTPVEYAALANTNIFAPGQCPADVSGDGVVGSEDVLDLILAWGPCSGCPEDLDGSGAVDVIDLLAVITTWGACP